MLPPLPRCSGWASSSLIAPSRVSLPRKGRRVGLHIVLFEACSASTRVAACTLARSPYFVTRYPKASDISSPPCLLRLLPAGANRRVGLAPTGKRRLITAHTQYGHHLAALLPADAFGGEREHLLSRHRGTGAPTRCASRLSAARPCRRPAPRLAPRSWWS